MRRQRKERKDKDSVEERGKGKEGELKEKRSHREGSKRRAEERKGKRSQACARD